MTTKQTQVNCECGRVYGERCAWSGPTAETVIVEVMPEWLRSSHESARNRGSYPANGADRIRVAKSCADRLVESEDGWATIL